MSRTPKLFEYCNIELARQRRACRAYWHSPDCGYLCARAMLLKALSCIGILLAVSCDYLWKAASTSVHLIPVVIHGVKANGGPTRTLLLFSLARLSGLVIDPSPSITYLLALLLVLLLAAIILVLLPVLVVLLLVLVLLVPILVKVVHIYYTMLAQKLYRNR